MKQCELIEIMKDGKTFRRYSNCNIDYTIDGITILAGKNHIFISKNNILGWESIVDKIIINMEVYCSNTF